MHYPDSRWPPCCQGKSRDVSGRIKNDIFQKILKTKSDKNTHQNAPNCTILKNFLRGDIRVANSHAYGVILTHLACYSHTHAFDKLLTHLKKITRKLIK